MQFSGSVKSVTQSCVKNCFTKANFEALALTMADERFEDKELSELDWLK